MQHKQHSPPAIYLAILPHKLPIKLVQTAIRLLLCPLCSHHPPYLDISGHDTQAISVSCIKTRHGIYSM